MSSPTNPAPGSPDPRTAPHVPPMFGPFAVLDKLGEGGMGAVYLAEDTKLKRRVAIKTMRPELAADKANRDRFEREARAAAAVEHANIVPILQVGEAADDTPFIVMPYLRGEPLDARLKREPVSPLWLVLKVAREVAEGLAAAHGKGLIHRDIKPANIWLDGDPNAAEPAQQVRQCKVLDFGLARSADGGDAQLTTAGAPMGTPAYMSPEQARGGRVDARSDLFSLGATLYRLATGERPFKGDTAMAVLCAVLTETPPPVRALAPHLPPRLADLIDRLMSKEPNGRPQAATDVSAAIQSLAPSAPPAAASSDSTPAVVPPAPPANPWEDVTETDADDANGAPPARPPAGRGQAAWAVGGLAAGLLALAALAAAFWPEAAEGTLVVEVGGSDAEAKYKECQLVLSGPDGRERYRLAPGERGRKLVAGGYAVRVEGASGVTPAPREFQLKRGDRVTVRVTAEPAAKPTEAGADRKGDSLRKGPAEVGPDRRAALYTLSIGGTVYVNGGDAAIRAVGELPTAPFRLTGVWLEHNARVSDDGLKAFGGCEHLEVLGLIGGPVGDAGLAHFAACTKLTALRLPFTRAGDAGLASFRNCKNLTHIDLLGTQVTDAGLAHLGGCDRLSVLWLPGTKATDVGLASFRSCKKLTNLNLNGTQVTDEGLGHFADCPDLTELHLNHTSVGDAGFAHLRASVRLAVAFLNETRVGDGAMAHLGCCPDLAGVHLAHTRVTAAGLAHLTACKNLQRMWIEKVKLTDADAGVLAAQAGLTELVVDDTELGDAGLAALGGLARLRVLGLARTRVGDAGAQTLSRFKLLSELNLSGTAVTDAGLKALADSRHLSRLYLAGTDVTDGGLAHLRERPSLAQLTLQKTRVRQRGVSDLAASLPGCRIEWDGGIIEPSKK